MKIYNLVLGDKDTLFNTKLIKYINTQKEQPFNSRGFSDKSILSKHIIENNIDVLLLTPEMYDSDISYENVKLVIIFSEGNKPNWVKELPVIYKYQGVNKILTKVMSLYSEVSEDTVINNNNTTKIVGVYSPIGRSGKTTLSFGICGLLSENKKVLCINLEELNSVINSNLKSSEYTLSDLLYYIRQKTPNVLLNIKNIVEKINGFDYIFPVRCYVDLLDTKLEEWQLLIEILKKESDYDVVVINFGNSIYSYTLDLISLCDEKILISLPDNASSQKFNSWMESIMLLQRDDLFINTTIVLNHQTSCNKIFVEDNIDFTLPYEEEINERHIHYDSEYGQVVNKIIKKLQVG
ncbi:cellulose biosynthesis protein BcsQ [Natranaerovirga pectinivora]|uniref:Cellulose biosynthesis protein BcsQ n=1 Tax=Natranaerovirga pectinivora TaxID=682400 RepID=A0A4R3MD42_9FIRM|nr:hypothetical protein [Natranaerovirga pectinivora]TCT11654.1 cellulose biosynthesis protein BcsQ [Natranaerovirga pectinivora]